MGCGIPPVQFAAGYSIVIDIEEAMSRVPATNEALVSVEFGVNGRIGTVKVCRMGKLGKGNVRRTRLLLFNLNPAGRRSPDLAAPASHRSPNLTRPPLGAILFNGPLTG